MNNMKQVGLAALMYAQDYEGATVPEVISSNQAYTDFWPALIQPYVKNWGVTTCPDRPKVLGENWPANPAGAPLRDGGGIAINDQLSTWVDQQPVVTDSLIREPSSKIQFADAGDITDSAAAGDNGGHAKAGYHAFESNPDAYTTYQERSEGVLFEDECRSMIADQAGQDIPIPMPRHQGMCVVAFFDGHAKTIKLSQYWLSMADVAKWETDADHFGQAGLGNSIGQCWDGSKGIMPSWGSY